ncbi:hypothetical protein Ahy_B10g100576 isoform C [Arachis hypogaea]|uniref:Uncharacterized protein n=1 Tax=Arachis hypogaea TaxID=3818 RepID=A0A444WX88_ARAHY|nr:hypothetical protein Ahy_B10g100576 isoform C [Arachis hypogaea]
MDTPLYLQRVSCVHCPLSVHNGSIPPSQVSTLTTHHPFLSLSLSTLLSECLSEIWVGLSFSFPREVHVNLAERSGHLNNPKGLLSLSFRRDIGVRKVGVLIMTRAVRNRVLKDANGDVSDHLRNHIHLTNCIHLKNHMHKNSPILADRSLMRDLVVLQRSRSLRDPSASPQSWNSPSVVDMLFKKVENDVMLHGGRRSVGGERRKEGRRLSGTSPPLVSIGTSRVAPGDASRGNDGVPATSERSSKSGIGDGKRVGREESGRKSDRPDYVDVSQEQHLSQAAKTLSEDVASRHSESKGRKKHKGKNVRDVQVKTLSEQLNDIPLDSDDLASSNIHFRGRFPRQEKIIEEAEASVRGHGSRVKRRKFRSARRARVATASRDTGAENELSVASNSLAHGSAHQRYHSEEADEFLDGNVTRAPKNGCGIPWNWSRIHHRGKTFLDMAGRSFTCGLSDSRLRKGLNGNGRNISEMPVASEHSGSSTKSDAEAMPLLLDASGSTENACWSHDYSGELGLFGDNLFNRDIDSDLASEARSGDQHKLRGSRHGRHQSLTQKYMPRTFRDMVGQSLVSQALSNAVMRRKVGLLYVFYGPHGTGKTSCARIFARALNCNSSEHPKPCGFCNYCMAHDMGKSRNIREVGPDGDIIYTLQLIATKEGLDIDKDALKLIASRSDGSLRDAEMTLEQLSLLGQRISVPLVQELVGLISDEKLIDLLDLALSADTVNTVKNLRVIMETGVEPLALMSQLATVITDILAGTYDFTKERRRRKFFRRQPV